MKRLLISVCVLVILTIGVHSAYAEQVIEDGVMFGMYPNEVAAILGDPDTDMSTDTKKVYILDHYLEFDEYPIYAEFRFDPAKGLVSVAYDFLEYAPKEDVCWLNFKVALDNIYGWASPLARWFVTRYGEDVFIADRDSKTILDFTPLWLRSFIENNYNMNDKSLYLESGYFQGLLPYNQGGVLFTILMDYEQEPAKLKTLKNIYSEDYVKDDSYTVTCLIFEIDYINEPYEQLIDESRIISID